LPAALIKLTPHVLGREIERIGRGFVPVHAIPFYVLGFVNGSCHKRSKTTTGPDHECNGDLSTAILATTV
jgi:hypothetical protein